MNEAKIGIVAGRRKGEGKGVRCAENARVKDAIRVVRRSGCHAVSAGDPIPLDGVALVSEHVLGHEIIAVIYPDLDEPRGRTRDLAKQGERKNQ
jgi:hypothetical protein